MTVFMGFPQDSYEFSADEVGRALAGLVRRESDGTPKTGVLAVGPDLEAVVAAWKVEVGPFTYVHDVSGAVQFSGLSASEQVDITSSAGIPGGQSRIDLICWDPDEPELVVVDGTPASTPSAPSSGGLPVLAEVTVAAGDGAVVQGQISEAYDVTFLQSAPERVQQGKLASRNVNSNSIVDVPVTFTPGLFTEAPVVVASCVSNVSIRLVTAYPLNVTKDGFTMRFESWSGQRRNFGVHWRAEQR